ncbi:MAG: retroviral-like aspartic protease family protein [Defluviitaleaceae bacterium]|nr:retroviral-like aspartic protease family protein [Defluviitaleaceae bacterium]
MTTANLEMEFFGGAVYVSVWLWSVTENRYLPISLMFDTGASFTTISPELLDELGYKPAFSQKIQVRTASKIEQMSRYKMDSIKLGNVALHDIEVRSHKFPETSFSSGVVGLNVLRHFDIEMLFSKGIIKLKKL